MDRRKHWEDVYGTRQDAELSWHETAPQPSLDLIVRACGGRGGVIDVGGGSSALVDGLLQQGFERIAVLDISHAALDRARARLGPAADRVQWIAADVTRADGLGLFDVWHDRAVFHFLTAPNDRRDYLGLARRTVPVGGHMVLATFGPNGPNRCSGLDVCRYDAAALAGELGPGFTMMTSTIHQHITPWGVAQEFLYAVFRRCDEHS
ncbi:MAG TPA: class I SAM-dependent methyltransferase [Tepidisphaeraceae bacterium]|nr:class I SAM-dependent methyltransferase [Tepidisphaeraceae bacterium]